MENLPYPAKRHHRGPGRSDRDYIGYTIDLARIPVVLAALAKELLEMEAAGDRARAEGVAAVVVADIER